ncbi:glycosyltransferase family 4 protein [Novosphingobium sp. YJ-S2-02]|uniref:Glycosyltransferase family 4 protein n=1 Tax=Novosphingobium aureum TaxID=2792964 RepID=A0A931HCS6_9SPHN|nr:glycosyltransferase family 4 protein [Novosphingobium aureum]MBH0113697.1 glycosyltransferase family 4 protein [Novosphingobium aureum]
MKVLVLSSLAYSLTNFRGALLQAMRANGHEVVAVAPDRDEAVEEALAKMGVQFRQIPMERTGTSPLADLRLLADYMKLMARERPDLVLAYTQKPIIYGGLAARAMRVRRFFALMSGLGYVFSEGTARRPILRRVVARLYREAVRRARAIFVFNADDREDMIALGIVSPSQSVIKVPGSGVDLDHFAQQPLPRDGLRFLLVGRLMQDKGIHEFAMAAEQIAREHPDCTFSVLGHYDRVSPTGIDEAECARLARRYPVRFIPGSSDVRPYLASASVFVLPSYYREGLPRTILEAMATGRAVITTDMPGCREPVVEGENGFLVAPRDAASLRRAMEHFIEVPGLAASMGQRSRELAEKVYDVHKVNHVLLDEMDLLVPMWSSQGSHDEAGTQAAATRATGQPAQEPGQEDLSTGIDGAQAGTGHLAPPVAPMLAGLEAIARQPSGGEGENGIAADRVPG